jgi:3-methyladenine DNA glycosylase AlkD
MTKSDVIAWLRENGTRRYKDGLARYGIVTTKAFGVPVGAMLKFAKRHGKDHALAAELWKSGWYEARMLAAMIDDPEQVTRQQMNAWVKDFDTWGICDTVCWHLFDYTPHAWESLRRWSTSREEFVKRAAFAMMAGQAGHNKTATDAEFLALLPLIEEGARDDRNFVKKAVSWALRRIGHRSAGLHDAAVTLARRLAASETPSSRWVGKDALRDLTRPMVRARFSARRSGSPSRSRDRTGPRRSRPPRAPRRKGGRRTARS